MLTHREKYEDDPGNLGWQQRRRHVELIRNGVSCYLVMREAMDVTAEPRSIRSFNDRDAFVGGKLLQIDGDWWIERPGRADGGSEDGRRGFAARR